MMTEMVPEENDTSEKKVEKKKYSVNEIWDITFKTTFRKQKEITGVIEYDNRETSPVITVQTQFGKILIKKTDIITKNLHGVVKKKKGRYNKRKL